LDICKWLLECYGAEDDHFLKRIITGDEIWIHHYKSESKCQSMEWKHHHHLPAKKNFKMYPASGSLMLTFFWDLQGLLLEHYQERGYTLNSARYGEMLCDKPKPAFRGKRRGLLAGGHVVPVLTLLSTLLKLNFEVLEHPLYSPDLAATESPVWST
jgi:hypothetical protein